MGMLEDALREYAAYEARTTDPSTPAAGRALVYFKDGALHTIDSAGTVTTYGSGAGGGGGAVLQVQTAVLNVNSATTSTSLVSSGLSVTITPTAADSTILLRVDGEYFMQANATQTSRRGTVAIRNVTDAVVVSEQDRGRVLVATSSVAAASVFPIALHGLYTVDSTSAREFRFEHAVQDAAVTGTILATRTGGVLMTAMELAA